MYLTGRLPIGGVLVLYTAICSIISSTTKKDMTFLDILIAIPLCYFIYKGWRRGIIFEVATLLGILAGIWAAVHLSTWVARAPFSLPSSLPSWEP